MSEISMVGEGDKGYPLFVKSFFFVVVVVDWFVVVTWWYINE